MNIKYIGAIKDDINELKEANIDKKFISSKYILRIKKNKKPFNISSDNTEQAIYLFPILRTLVAPIFPDPIFLISPKPKSLGIIKAKGIDPKK